MKFLNRMNKTNKKAQSEIITTVLIILLVLAAIVIVWQVIGKTVKGGGEEVESQASFIGINLEVEPGAAEGQFVVKRGVGGETLTANPELVVIVNNERLESGDYTVVEGAVADLKAPFSSVVIQVPSSPVPTKVEVGLKVGTKISPVTGVWEGSESFEGVLSCNTPDPYDGESGSGLISWGSSQTQCRCGTSICTKSGSDDLCKPGETPECETIA